MKASLRPPALLGIVLVLGLWSASAGAGFAGSNNVLYLLQDSSTIGAGESFQSDQGRSTNSSIGSEAQPALQSGAGDHASLTIDSTCGAISATCGHADLTQADDYSAVLADHPVAQALAGSALAGLSSYFGPNSATVSVTGQGSGSVSQYGFGNNASLSVDGSSVSEGSAGGSIMQVGLGNQASLNVSLTGSSRHDTDVSVNQFGANNLVNADVTATAGTTVSYTQIGSGLNYGSNATPVTIATTRSVAVTQTNFGTIVK